MVVAAKVARWAGTPLILGGILIILVNAGLSPLLPAHEVERSSIFLWRQSVAALAAAFLLFGSIAIHARQEHRVGIFGTTAYVGACLGSALLLAVEWNQIFLVRDLAFRVPGALTVLDAGKGPSLDDWGAILPLILFVLGWVALAASTLRTKMFSPWGAWLVIGGFVSIPVLSMIMPHLFATIFGNLILGIGFCWLGVNVSRPR